VSQTTVIQKWVAQLQSGEPAARGNLIDCVCERFESLTRQMKREFPAVARWEGTDDVVQGALLRLHRALDVVELHDAHHFLRLAATQIRRELIDLSRKHRGPEGLDRHHETIGPRHPTGRDGDYEPIDAASDTHSPERIHSWSELHEAVERLPAELREVFDLIWYHQLSQSDVANLLGVATRTVKRRWRDARLALHDALGGESPMTE
jgi:RNA polymerase sigma factor (sigma-70 family)